MAADEARPDRDAETSLANARPVKKQESKFFFEKKNQTTFALFAGAFAIVIAAWARELCGAPFL